MKSRRKIWSIPIAALATCADAFAGALAVSSIVQAQAAKNITGGGDVIVDVGYRWNVTFTTIADRSERRCFRPARDKRCRGHGSGRGGGAESVEMLILRSTLQAKVISPFDPMANDPFTGEIAGAMMRFR